MTKAAETVLGWEYRKQPDWFKENIFNLQEMMSTHNTSFARWLGTHNNSNRQRYLTQRRAVACKLRRAKNEWLQRKASEVERGMLKGGSGKRAWQSLREIQRGRPGLQPVRQCAVRKSDNHLCVSQEEILPTVVEPF